jgi:hypothetical protein
LTEGKNPKASRFKIQHHYKAIAMVKKCIMGSVPTMRLGLLCITAILCSMSALASIEPFKMDYKVSLGGISLGSAKAELRRERDGRYIFEKTAVANGLARMFLSDSISERAEWQLIDGYPKAMRFEANEKDGGDYKRELIVFDWNQNKVLTTWIDETKQIDIPGVAFDRLTLEMRMMLDVRESVETYEYALIERGKLKMRRFVPEGSERVKTPAGTFDTVKYRLVRKDSDRRSTLFWLARELGFLPVRMEHHDKKHGLVVAMVLNRFQSMKGK